MESTPETTADFIPLLDAAKEDDLTGFDFADGKVTITYQAHPDEPERNMVYAMLTARILKAAKEATRVFPERQERNGSTATSLLSIRAQISCTTTIRSGTNPKRKLTGQPKSSLTCSWPMLSSWFSKPGRLSFGLAAMRKRSAAVRRLRQN